MKKIFSILLASLAMSSCVDTVILPDNKILEEDYWKKKTEVEAVVGAAYAQLREDETLMRNMIVWADFRSDELIVNSAPALASSKYKIPLDEIYSMNIQPSNTFTSWAPFYSVINYCNLVLEKAEGVISEDPNYTRGDYETTCAQMKALRAWCYFYLVRVFRDVPVTPGAYLDSSADLKAPQKAPAEVLQMCIDDLLTVEAYAPANDAYGDERDYLYFNKDAVAALLADIYLWRASVNHSDDDYRQCVAYCDKVIAAKKAYAQKYFMNGLVDSDFYLYDCTSYYKSIFVSGYMSDSETRKPFGNLENIVEIAYNQNVVNNGPLWEMYHSYSKSSRVDVGGYLKTTEVYAKFNGSPSSSNIFKNEADQRRYENCYDVAADKEEYDVRKYVALRGTVNLKTAEAYSAVSIFTKDWVLYRLTDVMLMKAEALVQLEQPEEAFALVKAVNDRALSDADRAQNELRYSTFVNNDPEKQVLMERARELCFEGKRWFDLMRYNYRHMEGVDYTKCFADMTEYAKNSEAFLDLALVKYSVPAAMKAKMPTEPYLYMPINEEEIGLNTNLRQNPVYKSTSKY